MEQQRYEKPVEPILDLVGGLGVPTPAQQAALGGIHVLMVGYGSIARPMADRLVDMGASDFTAIDPKRYVKRSVASQCEPGEVDRFKVEVGAERLQRRGARATGLARDAYGVPDGHVRANTVVVVTADARRGDIRANRMAGRMGARLVKINVEPQFSLLSVRCYDLREQPQICAECQMSARSYQLQRHPKSCDGTAQRPTGSPRPLSQAAGTIGAVAVVQLLDPATASQWYGRELQWSLATGRVLWSELSPKPNCFWDHGDRWPNLVRPDEGPESISLADLAAAAGIAAADATQVRFCQQVALRASCRDCGDQVETVQWITDLDDALGACPQCGGRLIAIPFWMHHRLAMAELRPVLDLPLAGWGVEPCAVIELEGSGRRRSFVIGGSAPATA